MKKIFLFIVSFFALIISEAQGKGHSSASLEQDRIKALEYTWLRAQYAIDTVTLASIFDETFTSVEPQNVINKKEAITDVVASLNDWKKIGISIDSFILKDFLIRLYDNTAVSTFISTVKGKDNGILFSKQIHYHHIWYLRNGKWMAVSSLNTRIFNNMPGDEEMIRTLIAEREAARTNGDKSVGNRILHYTYTSINEIGGITTKSDGFNSPNDTAIIRKLIEQNKETQFKIHVDSFHIRFYNNIAIVNYRLFYNLVFNKEPCEKIFQCNEVLMKTVGNWRSVSHSETVIPTKPYAVKTDTTRFDLFTGQYQLFPTHIYNVVKENGKLYWGKVNKVELIPEDVNTFVPNGREFYRVRFESGIDGKVTSIRIIEYPGVEYSAIKIK